MLDPSAVTPRQDLNKLIQLNRNTLPTAMDTEGLQDTPTNSDVLGELHPISARHK